ncbi:MAG: hypothetical protein JXA69_09610 [Phycisphaerae bacterium]|nr:hypothetical protein [Phycisphaerae bacterium]
MNDLPSARALADDGTLRRLPGRGHDRSAYEAKRDKTNLDIFWLKDKSLEDSDDLPDPDVIVQKIADDLQAVLDQFSAIAGEPKAVDLG